jgi:hypothetical protein
VDVPRVAGHLDPAQRTAGGRGGAHQVLALARRVSLGAHVAAQAGRQRRQPGVGAARGARVTVDAAELAARELYLQVERVVERDRLRRRGDPAATAGDDQEREDGDLHGDTSPNG